MMLHRTSGQPWPENVEYLARLWLHFPSIRIDLDQKLAMLERHELPAAELLCGVVEYSGIE